MLCDAFSVFGLPGQTRSWMALPAGKFGLLGIELGCRISLMMDVLVRLVCRLIDWPTKSGFDFFIFAELPHRWEGMRTGIERWNRRPRLSTAMRSSVPLPVCSSIQGS